jgi:hypothetical protein
VAGSGAGSNFIRQYVLTNVQAAALTAVSVNGQGIPTAYGTLGLNDSGWWCAEARNFTKWSIELEQVGATALTGFSLSLYGTNSPALEQSWFNALLGKTDSSNIGGLIRGDSLTSGYPTPPPPVQGIADSSVRAGWLPGVAPYNARLLPGPAEQSGTGGIVNPLVAGTSSFFTTNIALGGIRVVCTTTGSPAGVFNVIVEAVP